MSFRDAPDLPEERVIKAIEQGPDFKTGTRYGIFSATLRRLVARVNLHSRRFQDQIDLALVDGLRDLEVRRIRDMESLRRELVAGLARIEDVETRAAVAATLADSAARTVAEVAAEMSDSTEQLARRIEETAAELSDSTERLARSIEDVQGAAKKAEFLYEEATARPFSSDPSLLRIVDADGIERLGYSDGPGPAALDAGFEAIVRGPVELIAERQKCYLDPIRDHPPVIDLGCGRGEFLELLASAGVEASGVDLDADMVAMCQGRGLDVELGDAVELLEKRPDASVGTVFSAQFVEHLSTDDLIRLLRVALDKLKPSGIFVAETINPHSPRALKCFWVDLTHQRPIFPETLMTLCRLTGYEEASISFPFGDGDLEADLRTQGEYAVVARAPR
ncbi:MAG TPA: methyltransferase domain-containing protein [Acidimicrobiia bacterium]|nr:methyltransferase domain-containing protein [Acidimicrobiia bacterium]